MAQDKELYFLQKQKYEQYATLDLFIFFLHENAPKYCMLNFKTSDMKTASIYMKTLKWVYTFYLYLNSDKY